MINVVIADDMQIIREGIKMMLSLDDEIEVVGECINGKELLDLLIVSLPDVVLMDIKMPLIDGVEATRLVKERYGNVKVLILTTFIDDEYIFEALKNGASGYMLKDAKSDELSKGIKTVYEGKTLLHPDIATKLVEAFNTLKKEKDSETLPIASEKLKTLTPRELELAKLIGSGKSNKEISSELYISEGTVKNYVSKIIEKLEAKSRTELILYMTKSTGR
ncbi:putative oxygen regulatory protein NreC [Clostridiales bacterium oral taxon 876 str. F0540]|nr:putative oxygen regulatory protein NreC [Clostridiales bacterium oral taxon 876 str. F0540]